MTKDSGSVSPPDARGAATNYLQAMAPSCGESVQPALLAAADAYAELERWCLEQRSELAPYPWDLAPGSAWTAEQRHRLAERLPDIAARDADAVQTLRRAITQLDGELSPSGSAARA